MTRIQCSNCGHEFRLPRLHKPADHDTVPGAFRSYATATGCLLVAMVAAGVGIGGGLRLVAWVAGW